MATHHDGVQPPAPGTFDYLRLVSRLADVYAWAYGYLATALDSWSHGRMSAGQLAADYERLQQEVAIACERLLTIHRDAQVNDAPLEVLRRGLNETLAAGTEDSKRKRVILNKPPSDPVIEL